MAYQINVKDQRGQQVKVLGQITLCVNGEAYSLTEDPMHDGNGESAMLDGMHNTRKEREHFNSGVSILALTRDGQVELGRYDKLPAAFAVMNAFATFRPTPDNIFHMPCRGHVPVYEDWGYDDDGYPLSLYEPA